MYLGNFIKKIDKKYHKVFFSGLALNSSKVKKNYIFFAIKGSKFDGNDYIKNAIKNGASVIISKKKINYQNKDVVYINSENPRKLLAELSYKFIKKKNKKISCCNRN